MRSLLALPVILGTLFLSACGGGNDPQNEAFTFCQEQVTATFDDPQTAEFQQWTGGGVADERRYEFESVVTADGQNFDLTCTVTGEPGSFELESYNLAAAG